MPQPYKLNKKVDFSPQAIVQRPRLATHIGFVNAMWARIDFWLAMIVVKASASKQLKIIFDSRHLPIDDAKKNLIEQTAHIAANIYLSLSGSAAKDAILKELLGEKASLEFEPLFKRVRSARKQRNRIAHGICGVVPELPDSLIIQDLDDAVLSAMSINQRACYIYKENDFLDLGKEISDLLLDLDKFQASEWKELLSPEVQPPASGPGQQQPPPESPKKAP